MFITLDRIEGNWAIFDSPDGEIRLPLDSLYSGVKEGDVCTYEHGRLFFNREETEKARLRLKDLSDALFTE
ncbi:MAG: DUF3006 domain-containing protein [Christensenellales bacterium]|jgi:hypothetical protein